MEPDVLPPSWGDGPEPRQLTTVAGLIAELLNFPSHMPVAVGWVEWSHGEWWLDEVRTRVAVSPEESQWSDGRPARTRVLICGEVDPEERPSMSSFGIAADEIGESSTTEGDMS